MGFFDEYFAEISARLGDADGAVLDEAAGVMLATSERGGKVIVAGNGASASIASHFAVDLTKNTGVRAVDFNEADLITCLANDYGYERWVEMAMEMYGGADDTAVLISSSGESANIVNAATKARRMGMGVITLSGFAEDNALRRTGDVNLWTDSGIYNVVESVHHVWLLAIVDRIAGGAVKAAARERSSRGIVFFERGAFSRANRPLPMKGAVR